MDRLHSSKGDYLNATRPDGHGSIDTAIPLEWANRMREQGINPAWFAWSYEKVSAWGEPMHLLEAYNQHLLETKGADILEYIKHLEYCIKTGRKPTKLEL